MGTVVLGWDPDRGNRFHPSYDDSVQRCRDNHGLLGRWPVGDWRLTPVGTDVHLMLQGRERGLVGRGVVRSAPFLAGDPAHAGQVTHHCMVQWTSLLPLDRRIPVEALEAAVPELAWRSAYAPAAALSPEGARQLELMWATTGASTARRLTRSAWRLLRR
jgi:5-methylcytosine-specific restriction protein A